MTHSLQSVPATQTAGHAPACQEPRPLSSSAISHSAALEPCTCSELCPRSSLIILSSQGITQTSASLLSVMQYSNAQSRPQAPMSGASRVTQDSIAEDDDSDDDFLAQASPGWGAWQGSIAQPSA